MKEFYEESDVEIIKIGRVDVFNIATDSEIPQGEVEDDDDDGPTLANSKMEP